MRKISVLSLVVLTVFFLGGIAWGYDFVVGTPLDRDNNNEVTVIPEDAFLSPGSFDFRDDAWAGAYGQESFTMTDEYGAITVRADVVDTQYNSLGVMYQDDQDGMGILNSIESAYNEADEIEEWERLIVEFDTGRYLTGVWISDLFDSPDGVVGEKGTVTGRPRKIGSFDFALAKYSATVNGATHIALTCIDRLFPEAAGVTKLEQLPQDARAFVEDVEKRIGVCPVSLISTGPNPEDVIDRRKA